MKKVGKSDFLRNFLAEKQQKVQESAEILHFVVSLGNYPTRDARRTNGVCGRLTARRTRS